MKKITANSFFLVFDENVITSKMIKLRQIVKIVREKNNGLKIWTKVYDG
jgi:hypothetical protein